jgi:hypothetical protein
MQIFNNVLMRCIERGYSLGEITNALKEVALYQRGMQFDSHQ